MVGHHRLRKRELVCGSIGGIHPPAQPAHRLLHGHLVHAGRYPYVLFHLHGGRPLPIASHRALAHRCLVAHPQQPLDLIPGQDSNYRLLQRGHLEPPPLSPPPFVEGSDRRLGLGQPRTQRRLRCPRQLSLPNHQTPFRPVVCTPCYLGGQEFTPFEALGDQLLGAPVPLAIDGGQGLVTCPAGVR